MSEARKKADWPIIGAVVLAVVLVPLALYVVSYFAMQRDVYHPANGGTTRFYDTEWIAKVFRPATKVESLLTGDPVSAAWPVSPPRGSP